MTTWELRVGAVQMRSTDDLAANLAAARELSARAAAEGAELVVLPECWAFLGRKEGDKLAIAESFGDGRDGDGPMLATLREIATKHGVWVVGGGTQERIPDDPKRTFNTAIAVGPTGAVAATYRKI